MNKRFKEGDIVFIEASSDDGYFFNYIGIIKKHCLSKKTCDFHVRTSCERFIQESYKDLIFNGGDISYDNIRLATEEETKLFADILQKDASKTNDSFFSTSQKSKDILERYFKNHFKQKSNITIQELIDKLVSIEDKSKEVFLLTGDSEVTAKKVVEELDTISIIG